MKTTPPRESLPSLGRMGRAQRIPAPRNALIVAMDRAVVVESASRYLQAGHSLKATAAALGIPLASLWKWIGAARRGGPAGLVPSRWRSGRRRAPRPARTVFRGGSGNAQGLATAPELAAPATVTLPNASDASQAAAKCGGGHS